MPVAISRRLGVQGVSQCSVSVELPWNWRATNDGKGYHDGLQHAGGVTPSLSGSTSRWDTLPRLGAVERPRPTLLDAFHQARAESDLPETDGRDSGPRARRRARASGVPLPGLPLDASSWVRAVPLARGTARDLCDATGGRGAGRCDEMLCYTWSPPPRVGPCVSAWSTPKRR